MATGTRLHGMGAVPAKLGSLLVLLAATLAATGPARAEVLNHCSGGACIRISRPAGSTDARISFRPSLSATNMVMNVMTGVVQRELPVGGQIAFRVRAGETHVFPAQACRRQFLGPSSCTPWRRFTYRVRTL